MNEIQRLLLLGDSRLDADLVDRVLRDAGFSHEMLRIEARAEFLERLERFDPDLILADAMLPRFDVMKVLQLARERAPEVPVVLIAESVSDETAVQYVRAGVAD